MSPGAVRAAVAVFLMGALVVWLGGPIRNACPDVGLLPSGSTAGSSPSFTPPLTRTCTYTTPDGTKAHKRYVPLVDWLILAVLAGIVGAGISLFGPAARLEPERPREPRPPRRDGG